MKQSIFIKIYIIPCMFISPLFSMSCNSWFSIWMSMEFNLMTFIPILMFFNKYYKELSMKYFIIQTISSSILIMSTNSIFLKLNYFIPNMMIYNMMTFSILMKMGAAPLHSWFINMMKNMSWINCMILSTWQKIIPTMCLMYLTHKNLIYLIIMISSITGALYGLNHQSIRIILSYSSINHISWMLLNMMISEYMWMLYFLSYLIINISIMMIFHKMKIFFINQIYLLNNLKMNKFLFLMNFISISGLPPMFGFTMKWLTIYFINWFYPSLIIIMMIILSTLTFIFYIRLCITFMMNLNLKNKMTLTYKFINLNKISFYIILMTSFNLNLWIMNIWLF